MTVFVDGLREDCDETRDWTMHGIRAVSSLFGHANGAAAASSGSMNSAFLSALRSRDVAKACETGQISENWPALAMGAIAQLDEAWNEDTLSIGEIAETYWTLHRTLDKLTSTSFQTSKPSLFIGKVVIWIPQTEQHTFGPQMLLDRIGRMGWDAQLWHDLDTDDMLEQLVSHDTDVFGFSVGTDNRLDGLADLITQVRRRALNPDLKVLVGGSAVRGAPSQYGFLGADCVAPSAESASHFFERGWSDLERREGRFDG